MSAIDNTPTNRNFLSPLNFKFQVKKLPNVDFFIQKVNFPSIALKEVNTSNPFVTTPYPGEHLTYGPLNISFKVDEDFQNYLEIHNWIRALGKPENFNQYKDIEEKPQYTGDGIYSDVSIISLNSAKMPNYEMILIDAFPVSLSELIFNTTDPDVLFITASAQFKYTYYNIGKI